MFTGIIQAVGNVAEQQQCGGDLRLRVHTGKLDLADVSIGDSIATNGVCLTVTGLPGDGFWADVSRETLSLTSIGGLMSGSPVNLEKSLTPSSRLGGHIVSGHVDGMGEIVSLAEDARSWRVVVRAPDELAKYIAHKGSICIDGTSLTVNAVQGACFDLNIIPQTMTETVFGAYSPGCHVNLEVDVIARYLERLLLGSEAALPGNPGISLETLGENGYLGGLS
ncbi:MAG: riboflavin synthase [Halieaceae bacterium]|jgi:riboflavin synthase